jgi:hypothetical protein
MAVTHAGRRHLGLGAALVLSAVLPACSSPDGARFPWLRGPAPDGSNIAYRPVYGFPPPKPLVIGGYAGASYPPLGARRQMSSVPVETVPDGQPSVSVSQGTWEPE